LHLGHARTFWVAQQRAQTHGGTLVLRNEDLDRHRSKPEFVTAMLEDLRWFGFQWQEGPDCGGPYAPYSQSERLESYRRALEKLRVVGFVYPCVCSRQDVLRAIQAPHVGEDEPIYPGTCRPGKDKNVQLDKTTRVNWRFQVPDGEAISFIDVHSGLHEFVAARDFGDFVVWRYDDLPSYQLAVVVDDAAMAITEVVRGEDLLKSTARQLLLYRALGLKPPKFYHCPVVTDESGVRLAKRHAPLSLRNLQAKGLSPQMIKEAWGRSLP
jgi:glutamyl-tRNA synthetase